MRKIALKGIALKPVLASAAAVALLAVASLTLMQSRHAAAETGAESIPYARSPVGRHNRVQP